MSELRNRGAEGPEVLLVVRAGLGRTDARSADWKSRSKFAFCGKCGTEIVGFRRLREAVEKMESFRKEKRWSRVSKEYSLIANRPRLPGKQGMEIAHHFEELNREAVEMRVASRQDREGTERGTDGQGLRAGVASGDRLPRDRSP